MHTQNETPCNFLLLPPQIKKCPLAADVNTEGSTEGVCPAYAVRARFLTHSITRSLTLFPSAFFPACTVRPCFALNSSSDAVGRTHFSPRPSCLHFVCFWSDYPSLAGLHSVTTCSVSWVCNPALPAVPFFFVLLFLWGHCPVEL